MLSANFILKAYGLRAEVIPFVSNYFVGAVDVEGQRTHCEHHHRKEATALACAEKLLRKKTKECRKLEQQKRGIPEKLRPFKFKVPRNFSHRRAGEPRLF